MKKRISKNVTKRKRKINKRLKRKNWSDQPNPMLSGWNIHYDFDGRHKGISNGGIGAIHLMNRKLGIVEEECDEVLFWLDMIEELKIVKPKQLESIINEANEILSIIVSSIKTAKRNR